MLPSLYWLEAPIQKLTGSLEAIFVTLEEPVKGRMLLNEL